MVKKNPHLEFMVNYNIALTHISKNSPKQALGILTKLVEVKGLDLPLELRWKVLRLIIQVHWMMCNFTECLEFISILKTEILLYECKIYRNRYQ